MDLSVMGILLLISRMEKAAACAVDLGFREGAYSYEPFKVLALLNLKFYR